jgi:predicted N-acyltransferase
VFDYGWARAYHQHGLNYHPKAVCAVPFIPVPGSRLLARSPADRALLVRHLLDWVEAKQLTGLHGLFASDEDVLAFQSAGMLPRHTVQFHWSNTQPGYTSFDDFLASLSQEKRKKIRQERRKVAEAGVTFKVLQGSDITQADWDFFYHCYERTYLEHGNPPYFNRAFYASMAADMPEDWVLFIAEQSSQPIASSLLAVNASSIRATGQTDVRLPDRVAYGRYWGALKRVDCLHFEACYYQPLQWCIEHGYQRFEGGAQGEHKLARALLPVTTTSMHWLAHPEFFNAVDQFLVRERAGIADYVGDLQAHSPFKA